MSRARGHLSIGDRVELIETGATGTVVEHIKPGPYVGVRWDVPMPARFADGKPTTATHWCCHESLLRLQGQDVLL